MGLLSRGSSGCQAHHWEPTTTRDDFRVRWATCVFLVEQRARFECAHDGCRAHKDDYKEVARVSINKDGDGEFHDPNAETVVGVLDELRAMASESASTGERHD